MFKVRVLLRRAANSSMDALLCITESKLNSSTKLSYLALSVIIVIVLCCASLTAQAFKSVFRGVDHKIDAAHSIVHARLATITDTSHPQTGLPFRHYTFKPIQVIKGWSADRVIELRFVRADQVTHLQTTLGALPELKIGDELILFLGPDGRSGRPTLMGYTEGLYRIQDRGGQRVVVEPVRVAVDSAAMVSSRALVHSGKLTADQFINYLQSRVKKD